MRTPLMIALLVGGLMNLRSLADDNWPQFRGRDNRGIGSGRPPVNWDITTRHHVGWKTAIPGLGHSAPIVWNDRVFITTAVNSNTDSPSVETGWSGSAGESARDIGEWKWQVISLNLATGDVEWVKTACNGKPTIKRHLKSSHANSTPATDGKYIVAMFGSEGLYCFDFGGQLIWKRDFGRLHSGPYDAPELEWGFASSPVIQDGNVIIQCDCLNTSFVAILDLKTGDEIRRIDRDGEVATWSTPLVVKTENQQQVVCNGYRMMAGYDLKTGSRIWHLNGGGDVPVPSPLFANGLIYMTNSHGRSPIYAIHPNANGDITPGETAVAAPGLSWWLPREGSYMPTPLISGKRLYVCNDSGRLTVINGLTGELIYRRRIGTTNHTYSASAVAAGGQIYFVSESGEVSVVADQDEFELRATNNLNEIVMATPAISGDRLLIRTVRNLYCLTPQ